MAEIPRYEITHGGVTIEAVVIQADSRTIVQPVKPAVVRSDESFVISGGARTVTPDDWHEEGSGVTVAGCAPDLPARAAVP